MLVQENIFRYTVIKKKKKLVRKVINKKALIINWHTMFKTLPTTALTYTHTHVHTHLLF